METGRNITHVALDFDEAQLDSMIAKAERLKRILTECHELIKGLPNPPRQEMPFDEFVRRLSNYMAEIANDAKNAEKA